MTRNKRILSLLLFFGLVFFCFQVQAMEGGCDENCVDLENVPDEIVVNIFSHLPERNFWAIMVILFESRPRFFCQLIERMVQAESNYFEVLVNIVRRSSRAFFKVGACAAKYLLLSSADYCYDHGIKLLKVLPLNECILQMTLEIFYSRKLTPCRLVFLLNLMMENIESYPSSCQHEIVCVAIQLIEEAYNVNVRVGSAVLDLATVIIKKIAFCPRKKKENFINLVTHISYLNFYSFGANEVAWGAAKLFSALRDEAENLSTKQKNFFYDIVCHHFKLIVAQNYRHSPTMRSICVFLGWDKDCRDT